MFEAGRCVTRKIRLRVWLPIMLSSLHRVDIRFAALQINTKLGLTPQLYGFAVGSFWHRSRNERSLRPVMRPHCQ